MIRLVVRVLIYIVIFSGGFALGYIAHSVRSLISPDEVMVDTSNAEGQSTNSAEAPESSGFTASSSVKTIEKPIQVPLNTLTDSQRAALEKVGITGSSLTLTPKMVQCAYDTLGKERVDEIIKGMTPSTLEAIRLTPCLK